ncbi:collagenase [Paenibacillus alvei]|uniref:collagenase n=1 Tax=Paenibacillus alvei TaxID=44250 RepID=UPI002282F669|nr:collagenase [Paenibacillus alvei]
MKHQTKQLTKKQKKQQMKQQMKQRAWVKWTSILLAATVATGSTASFAAAEERGLQVREDAAHTGIRNVIATQDPSVSDLPLDIEGRLPMTEQSEAPGIPEPPAQALKSISEQSTYSMADLSAMSYEDLTDLLVSIDWEKIPELFKFNEDTRRFYADENRMQAIIDRLEESGRRFTTEDMQGIPTLVEVLRSGVYLGYYNKELSRLNELDFREKMLPAMKAIVDNPSFTWGNEVQHKVISSTGRLISNVTVDTYIVNRLTGLLSDFNDRIDHLGGNFLSGKAFYDVLEGVGYVLMYRMTEPDQKAEFKGNIDGYLEQLFRLGSEGSTAEDKIWLTSNAIYYSGALGHYHSDPQKANRVLTNVMQTKPKLGELYFVAADQIARNYDEKDAYGNRVDIDELKKRGKEHYLPQRVEFDDGQFVIRAGGQLTQEQLQRLYWAAKEVKAQFHRVIGNDKPLEAGNPDDVLTIVIYNNPDEYKMNRLLYGYSTDNGGIYIEGDGTFFTYDRTEAQSIYSLEELFRHEFTHYLQARFEVPGMFGQGPLYQGGRMQWFDEGGAEFFAGATRMEGIQPRKSVVGYLVADEPGQRYTVSDTVNSKYGSWQFYNYSFALYDYLYHHDFTAMDRIHRAIRNNDGDAYEQQLESISGDARLNESYQRSIEEKVARYDKLSVPLVSDDYLKAVEAKPELEIYDEITNLAGLSNRSVKKSNSGLFKSYELRGTYVGGASAGVEQDWQTMNKLTDGFLQALSDKPWNGYKTLTAYFTNYRVNDEGNFVYDVVFNGKLPEGADGGDVELPDGGTNPGNGNEGNNGDKDGDQKDTADREPNDTWKTAVRLDDTGKTISGKLSNKDALDIYRFDAKQAGEWTIELESAQELGVAWVLFHESDPNNYQAYPTKREGNSLAGSISVSEPGTYYLHVYAATEGDQSYRLAVKSETQQQPEPEVSLFEETEPNDAPDMANGPVPVGRTVNGTLEGDDKQDVFMIDLDKPTSLNIGLEKQQGEHVNWVLYREGDNEQVLYPVDIDGNWMKGQVEAEPGRYHLYVYKFADEDVRYKLEIQ